MTQRERILTIAIGGLLAVVFFQWGFNKYRTAVRTRSNQIQSLQSERLTLEEQQLQGAYAERQMGEYQIRSLPGVPERAQSDYQSWLLNMVQQNQLGDPRVNPSGTIPVGDLYNRLSYTVDGRTSLPRLIDLLHSFYAKDYLHRISKLQVTPARDRSGLLDLKMSIDAISLNTAPVDLQPLTPPSWRVDPDVTAYQEPILNRNFFEPPNQPPQFTGNSQVEAFVGKSSTIPLTFKDPEGHPLRFELDESAPESVRLDSRTGTLTILSDQKQSLDLLVRVVDGGYPARAVEQKLAVNIVDPPPPPEPEVKRVFDDSTQTVLTALVQGRDDWSAWMNVRTQGKTLKLKVGDAFEVGSLRGSVVEVTPRYAVLEIDGRRFELKPAGVLSEAAKQIQED